MSVATVRLLCADPENYDRAIATADGLTVEFRLPQGPVVVDSESVSVSGVPLTKPGGYSIAYELGLVTLVATPDAGDDVVIPYRHTILSDATLDALLTLEGGNDKLAAAQALDVIASSEALVSKKIELLDLKTDGPAVATALRAHAQRLRDQVEAGVGDDPAATFDTAEIVADKFAARERVMAEALRQ